ncbi:MAG: hypothetical protein ACI8RC_001509, partial [Ilumatobacter sp.]
RRPSESNCREEPSCDDASSLSQRLSWSGSCWSSPPLQWPRRAGSPLSAERLQFRSAPQPVGTALATGGSSMRLLRRRQYVLSPPAPSPTAEPSPASCTSWSDMATGGKSPTESWCRLICGAATGWWLDRGSVRRRAECTSVCGLAVSIGIQRPISGARPAAPVSCLSTAPANGRRRYRSGVVATWGELGRGRCV